MRNQPDQLDLELIDNYQKTLGGKIVPVYIRFFAFLIDSLIKFLLLLFIFLQLDEAFNGTKSILIAFSIALVYETLFLSSKLKATPGKMFMGIVVVNSTGHKLNLIRSLYRYICRFFSVYILGIGVLYALSDILKRTYHCNISRSYVISPFNSKKDEPYILDEDL